VHRIEADGVTLSVLEDVDAPWRYFRVEGASHWL
jgi:hypothetical protein